MPKFKDQENQTLLEPGDYIFCVVGCNPKISTGPTTAGSDQFVLEIDIEPSGNRIKETLTDHPKCDFRIDTFIKSAGAKLKLNEDYDFRKEVAESEDIKWINPIGLRGWCRVKKEVFERKSDVKGKPTGESNKIDFFYTNKEKLPARVIEVVEGEQEPF